jgi:flagellar protein FliO/FliZ
MLLTTASGLALSLALVLIVAWLARSFGFVSAGGRVTQGAGRRRRLDLIETFALDARRRLHLVSCDGRDVLVLTGGGQDVMVVVEASQRRAVDEA